MRPAVGRASEDARVLAAAPLADPHGEIDVPLALDRPPAQGGVAVAALPEGHVVADGVVLVVEGLGELPPEVELARAGRPLVHLLQHHDIRVVVADDRSDPLRTEAAVDTDGAVDVVAENPNLHQRPE